ncbi:myb/SANT-like domain-containing protein (mitochondrion) [Artemisia annua]|uniref:Myb/SANT-like domain-containing protein n=1 Tax=Artemisia annua TaxID=35608 RepID=A0A2U1NJ21_ARTAN|nr:myb/SANT-like domain-containing protein [Artemisia annua]
MENTGFRSNYMCEVHRRILVKRPNFSKNVSPHIESKVKWLKSKFHAINDMLKQSGCSWIDIDKKIACEREWYLSYCKDAQGLRDVEFPYFNQLKLVYGKDSTIGLVAEGYGDTIHNLEVEQNVESGGENIGDFHVSLSDDEENDVPTVSQATQTTSNLKHNNKDG